MNAIHRESLLDRFQRSSLQNKIFVSTLVFLLLISILIALFTRWILISSLTAELQRRGIGIASSLAKTGRYYLLTGNLPGLTRLILDARSGEQKDVVAYVIVNDESGETVSHTFENRMPATLDPADASVADHSHSIRSIAFHEMRVYDIAVPILEGSEQIGTIHVGLNKKHIERLIGKLRTTFLAFLSAVSILFFVLSHRLSRHITRPIAALTEITDAISRGNFDISADLENRMDGFQGEVQRLAESFRHMLSRIKASQLQLKESEDKYRSLFTGGPNPIFVIDRRDLRILDVNPIAIETYGYRREELLEKRFSDLGLFADSHLDPAAHFAGKIPLNMVIAKEKLYKKNGQAIYVNIHGSPTTYQNREAMIVATTDISEMLEKDSQLIQASKMTTLGEMSAGIAHELNQPLNAIKMGCEYLGLFTETDQPISNRSVEAVHAEISGQVDRAAAIINRLRDFGRKADFSRDIIQIQTPILAVCQMVARQLELQNIRLEIDVADEIPPILAHENRIEQVVFNLITNARDAINHAKQNTPTGYRGTITIRAFAEESNVVLAVSDTGIGIAESLIPSIFDSFFTTKKMGEGMGLGLSITSGIVGDYHGTISVASREGIGTTFKVVFPAAADSP